MDGILSAWRGRPLVIVLDDFEANFDELTLAGARLRSGAAEVLGRLQSFCLAERAKLLITSTAMFEWPGRLGSLAAFPLGPLGPAEAAKLWSRGQEGKSSLREVGRDTWLQIARCLGYNARVMDWVRQLVAGGRPEELMRELSTAEELARVAPERVLTPEGLEAVRLGYLRHFALEKARAAAGEPAIEFLGRARVYEIPMPAAAFLRLLVAPLREDALARLADLGLLEVGTRAPIAQAVYRVSPLIAPELADAIEPAWHAIAAQELAREIENGNHDPDVQAAAWRHSCHGGELTIAERMATGIHLRLRVRGEVMRDLALAREHVAAFPDGPEGLWWLGEAAWGAGLPVEARPALEHSVSIYELNGNKPALAASLQALACVLQAMGDVENAKKHLERCLTLHKEVHGKEEHPDVAASLHELGRVFHAMGDLPSAKNYLERCLSIQAVIFGTEEHPQVAASLHELASVFKTIGDLPSAKKHLERSIRIKTAVFDTEEHPSVAASLHELAGVLRALGDLPSAKKHLERSLAISEVVFGTETHPQVAASLHQLAGVLYEIGDLRGAKKRLEQSLAIAMAVFGTEEHPQVAASLHQLARVMRKTGDRLGAKQLFERALGIRTLLGGGREHYFTATTELCLGALYHEIGDPRASALVGHALSVFERDLGPDHELSRDARNVWARICR